MFLNQYTIHQSLIGFQLRATHLSAVVEFEAGGTVDIVVTPIAEGVVRANNDLWYPISVIRHHRERPLPSEINILTATWKFDCCELFLVVLLEGWAELRNEGWGINGESFDIWKIFSYVFREYIVKVSVVRSYQL